MADQKQVIPASFSFNPQGFSHLTTRELLKSITDGVIRTQHNQRQLEDASMKIQQTLQNLVPNVSQVANRVPEVEQKVKMVQDRSAMMKYIMENALPALQSNLALLEKSVSNASFPSLSHQENQPRIQQQQHLLSPSPFQQQQQILLQSQFLGQQQQQQQLMLQPFPNQPQFSQQTMIQGFQPTTRSNFNNNSTFSSSMGSSSSSLSSLNAVPATPSFLPFSSQEQQPTSIFENDENTFDTETSDEFLNPMNPLQEKKIEQDIDILFSSTNGGLTIEDISTPLPSTPFQSGPTFQSVPMSPLSPESTDPPKTPCLEPTSFQGHVLKLRSGKHHVRPEGLTLLKKLLCQLLRLGLNSFLGYVWCIPVYYFSSITGKIEFVLGFSTGGIVHWFEILAKHSKDDFVKNEKLAVNPIYQFLETLQAQTFTSQKNQYPWWDSTTEKCRSFFPFWVDKKQKNTSYRNLFFVDPNVLCELLYEHPDSVYTGDERFLVITKKSKRLKNHSFSSSSVSSLQCYANIPLPKEFFEDDGTFLAWKALHAHPLWTEMTRGGGMSKEEILSEWGIHHYRFRWTTAFAQNGCIETVKSWRVEKEKSIEKKSKDGPKRKKGSQALKSKRIKRNPILL